MELQIQAFVNILVIYHLFDQVFFYLKIKQWVAGSDLRNSKLFIFVLVKLYKNTKINWKDFCKEICKKLWKNNNTWNIRRLVGKNDDRPIAPAYWYVYIRPLLYWRFSDFFDLFNSIYQ